MTSLDMTSLELRGFVLPAFGRKSVLLRKGLNGVTGNAALGA